MVTRPETTSVDEADERRVRRTARLKNRPRLPAMTLDEFAALFKGADPPTEDDVPWTFPVRTPVRRDSVS